MKKNISLRQIQSSILFAVLGINIALLIFSGALNEDPNVVETRFSRMAENMFISYAMSLAFGLIINDVSEGWRKLITDLHDVNVVRNALCIYALGLPFLVAALVFILYICIYNIVFSDTICIIALASLETVGISFIEFAYRVINPKYYVRFFR